MIAQNEIPQAKILQPSMAEFTDFEAYVESLDNSHTFQEYGMVKVIFLYLKIVDNVFFQIVPPSDWKSRSDNVENALDQIVVSSPIEQNVQGRSGFYMNVRLLILFS